MDISETIKIFQEIKELELSIENRSRLIKAPGRPQEFISHHKNMIDNEKKLIEILKLKLSKMEK